MTERSVEQTAGQAAEQGNQADSDARMIAYALETTTELLPYIPELLADLEELGSDAELIVEVLEALDLPADTQIVDLGCGKGVVAVEIADELGLQVIGIDLFAPFVDAATSLAEEVGVSALCDFRQGNIDGFEVQLAAADVAIFAALGDTLGGLEQTMEIVRRYVRPGGFMVISDAFLVDDGSSTFPGFESYAPRSVTEARLESRGDWVERVVLEPAIETGGEPADEKTEVELIRARSEVLATSYPEMREALLGFAETQELATRFIDANLQGAIWVVRRAP